MKIINTRSPYIIPINQPDQDYGKLEIRIWKPDESKPLSPTYTFTKGKPSDTNREVIFNISPFLKDVIENKVENIGEGGQTYYNYVNAEIKRYYKIGAGDYTLIDTETLIAMNGYTSFRDGVNKYNETTSFIDLTTYNITPFGSVPLYYDRSRYDEYYVQLYLPSGSVNIQFINSLNQSTDILYAGGGIINIPITTDEAKFNDGNYLNIQVFGEFGDTLTIGSIKVIPVCEPITTPVVCSYVNRFGAIQQLTFFKMRTDTIDITSDKFNLMPSNWSYDTGLGTYKQFNFNGKQSIKLNTGFVPEEYSEMIKDIMLSEYIWLDGSPANIKTNSMELKTQIKNRNINYELDFELGYDIINNVV